MDDFAVYKIETGVAEDWTKIQPTFGLSNDCRVSFDEKWYESEEPVSTCKPLEPRKSDNHEENRLTGITKKEKIKPVSAYALFFREQRASVKTVFPSATFGEISKIIASLWDALSLEQKMVYKRRTESSRRRYIKEAAAASVLQLCSDLNNEKKFSKKPLSDRTNS